MDRRRRLRHVDPGRGGFRLRASRRILRRRRGAASLRRHHRLPRSPPDGPRGRPSGFRGARLGLYGFGAAGHIAIQIARARGADVYVMTRDRERHQALAEELGAAWVGGARDVPPTKLDAAIIFAPAGELIPAGSRRARQGRNARPRRNPHERLPADPVRAPLPESASSAASRTTPATTGASSWPRPRASPSRRTSGRSASRRRTTR